MGPVVGMLGTIQAQMALAVLLGLSPAPLGQLVTLAPGLRWGGFRFDDAPEAEDGFRFIDTTTLMPGDWVVDLRGLDEAPVPVTAGALRGDAAAPPAPPANARAVFACRSGLRAWRAARATAALYPNEIALIAIGETR